MPIPNTVQIGGIIAPGSLTDRYPVTDPLFGLGGFRTVSASNVLTDIPSERLQEGMVAFVSGGANTGYYQYVRPNWVLTKWESVYTQVNAASATYIVDGGNSRGAAIRVGTNDNFGFSIETNGSDKFTIANTGDITITNSIIGAASQNVFNTTSTTVNAFGAATSISIGASTGTLTIGNATITGTNATTLNLNGANPSIVTTQTGTASVFNTNITTGNLFGAATNISIGSSVTTAQTVNVGTGATSNGNTKTINIGTNGAAGSTSNINIGSLNGGTTAIAGNTTVGGTLGVTGVLTTSSTIELGNASDTTLARSAAGVVTIEGVEVVTLTRSQSLTNKTYEGLTISTGTDTFTLTRGTATLVRSGAHALTLTTTGATNVTLPTTGTLATLADTTNVSVISTDNGTLTIDSNNASTYLNKILHVRTTSDTRINFESSLPVGFNMLILNESTFNVVLTSTVDNVFLAYSSTLSGQQGDRRLFTSASVYKYGNNVYALGSLV